MQTTVVGNYPKIPNRPKPARYRNAINKRDRGEITNEELAQVGDEVTIEVIQEQVDAGVDVITDGQVRWDDDQTYVTRRMKGVKIGALQRYLDTNTYFREPEITGEIEWESPTLVRDWQFARDVSNRPVKAVLPGPYTLAVLSVDKHYGSREDVALAYAEALRNEAEALVEAGCLHVQVNDPVIVFNKQDIDIFTNAIDRLLGGIDVETGVYTWFGDATGILPQLIDMPVDVIGLDFVAGPANWDAIETTQFGDKKLGAGIVDGRNTRLESPAQVADAMKRLERHVGADRLYLNPSCGLEYMPRETAYEKLRTMVEGAKRAEGVPA